MVLIKAVESAVSRVVLSVGLKDSLETNWVYQMDSMP